MRDWRDAIRKQLAVLHLDPAREAEIVEELADHVEDRHRDLTAAGVEHTEARRTALEEVTAHELLATGLRAVERAHAPEPIVLGGTHGAHWVSGLGQDLRYGLRTLRTNPGFTAAATLALALGIGANTAVFSLVNGVLLQPLDYPDADRLVTILETTPEFGTNAAAVAYPNYLDWRRESRAVTDLGAFREDDFNLTGAGEPERLSGLYVSASLFQVLGVAPVLGRNFGLDEDRQGAACTVMLSYGLWHQRFGGDSAILGKALTLNGMNCAVVGVAARAFRLADDAQVYLPIELWNSISALRSRESHAGLVVIGRLKPGVTIEAAQREMATICSELARQYPKTNASHSARVVGMKEDIVRSIRPTLLLLAAAVGFVLVIACANVANLLLARSSTRQRELAIRAALGAERWRVVRQLLIESVLLALGAGSIGLLLARWWTTLGLSAAPASLPRAGEVGIDLSVLLFTGIVAVVTGILFGLAPALHGANASPQAFLKEGARGAGGGRSRGEGVFVAVEIALSLTLVAGAGLMIQTVWRLLQIDPGFNPRNVLTMRVALSPGVMTSAPDIRRAYVQLLDRVASAPGVESTAVAGLLPLDERDNEIAFWQGGGPQPAPDRMTAAVFYVVTPDYPRVMQIPLRRGRFFTDRDNVASPQVVVIDDVMANRLFPDRDPVGRQMNLMILGPVQIVGVVGHVKQWGLASDDTHRVRDQIYFPFLQVPDRFMTSAVTGWTVAVRTRSDPASAIAAVRAGVAGPTHDQPVYTVRTMEQIVSTSISARRFVMLVLIMFGATALLLAAIGIYAVTSYSVIRRTHELGIRAALGASRREIVRLVLREGMTPAALGLGAGLAASVVLMRLMAGLLYGVRPTDPLTLAAVAVLLAAIALFACYLPARRATAVDPMIALRCE
jgi:putative ABC transport system permease protein